MIARSFLDSNVIVYTDDPKATEKRVRAVELVAIALRTGLGVVSTQVLKEYFSATTRKLATPSDAARRKVEALCHLHVVQLDPTLILAAIDLHRLHQISFWDALIVQAAASGGCVELLTEDLQAGRRIAGVLVVDPFRP
jgi:predicted nucleic acid-binding protein